MIAMRLAMLTVDNLDLGVQRHEPRSHLDEHQGDLDAQLEGARQHDAQGQARHRDAICVVAGHVILQVIHIRKEAARGFKLCSVGVGCFRGKVHEG